MVFFIFAIRFSFAPQKILIIAINIKLKLTNG